MPLTDVAIRNAKPTGKLQKLSDGAGLQLWVMPAGSRLWRLAYRHQGKQKLLALGAYPTMALSQARDRRERARKLLADGIDPGEQKKADKRAKALSDANTFGAVADELLRKKEEDGKAERTLEKTRWLFDLAKPSLGDRPITEISAREVLDVLERVQAKGHRETAKRLRAVIGQVFRFAIATTRAANDPTFALRGALLAPKVKHRAALTKEDDFAGLLRAVDGFQGQPTTKAALQLMALLFPRPGELRPAEWSEFDLKEAVWTIPASRMKMRQEHRIPLPSQALAILKDLKTLTGNGKLVFPGYGISGGEGRTVAPRPISENTLNAALRRMGFGADEMTSHGFRAAASTLLNESGKWSADAIERALAHQDKDAVRRAYARGQHWDERVQMAQWWADELDRLKAKRKGRPE
ncbi:tyrosine-type recombinase/integrase [Bosea minatitlanensis]|uniref:Tyrosine-type recombinase/integrase n=1 Tax=Bosea minatitlanensis TaxID=128782 RepID=A0ABW0F7B6_9HYPH|nr:integrase arm-type DNA-binding domain-containing protein [Bosea minatitlanensis]MCT4493108.1 integrase arm-type DNA-binding domain-containing protein [Bosea minatitlanensis]